jgi:nucleotide-binding universal stress UspA family protein
MGGARAPRKEDAPARQRSTRPCLVVGYDGSPEARAAVAYAAGRAGRSGRVVVVHAPEPGLVLPGLPAPEGVIDDRAAHGEAVLDALILEGGNDLIDTQFDLELAVGSAAEALVDAAARHRADEIVIGSRGFGRVRAALGSVSHEVLHRADRPVVVVPHGALGQDGDE